MIVTSSEEIEDLLRVIELGEQFKEKWGYNPTDNYAWREVLTFNYLQQYYPTITKLGGRYGADGECSELGLSWIEQKSVNVSKRKRTSAYNFDKIYFEIDTSESRIKKLDSVDSFIFSMFDAESADHPFPIHVLFIHEEHKVAEMKQLIREEIARQYGKRKRETVEMRYVVFQHLAEKYGIETPANFMEFLL